MSGVEERAVRPGDRRERASRPAASDGRRGRRGRADESGTARRAERIARPIGRGLLAGVGAFVAGYALTAVAFLLEASAPGADGAGGVVETVLDRLLRVGGEQIVAAGGGELRVAARAIGWTFYSAHGVPVTGSVSGLGRSVSGRVDLLALAGEVPALGLTPWVYDAVPPVCLAAAGWWLARRPGVGGGFGGAAAGALVAVGYLLCVLAVTGLLALSVTVGGTLEVRAGPALSSSVLSSAGYAVAFGAVGGAARGLAYAVTSRE